MNTVGTKRQPPQSFEVKQTNEESNSSERKDRQARKLEHDWPREQQLTSQERAEASAESQQPDRQETKRLG